MRTLNVGIAGYGVVGKKRRECIEQHPQLQLTAICDQHFQNSGTMPDGVRYYHDYRQILAERLDILFVCLTNDLLSTVTIAGLENSMHVFCEKPPARSIEDLLTVMPYEVKHPKLRLVYGFNHRYHDSVLDALRIIRSGELGTVINLRGVYGKSQLVTFNQPAWRTKREIAGGGVLLDQGIHMVDLMRLFGGEFDTVHSFVSNKHWGYDVEDNAYALMRTSTGIVAMLNSSATQWRHRFNLDINLSRGSIVLGGLLTGSKSYGAETLTVVRADPNNDCGDPREESIHYNFDASWKREIDSFVAGINSGEAIESGSSRDALATMRLVFSIYYADHEWRTRYNIPNPNSLLPPSETSTFTLR